MTGSPGRPRILIASEPPGGAAGISVAAEVLLGALERFADVGVMYHAPGAAPSLQRENGTRYEKWRLGTQPILVHAEGTLGGLLHRRRLASWDGVWAVGSRHAGAARAAGVPYVVWEATTIGAELRLVTRREARATGLGSGWGAALHRALGPINDRIEGAVYRGAAARLGMSEYSRGIMAEQAGLPLDAVQLLPAPPRPAFLDALAAAGPWRPGTGPLRVLLVGRVSDTRKNVPLFVEAMRRLHAQGVPIQATVIGPITEETRATLARDAAGWLTLAGRVEMAALADAYRAHDILMITSRQEGYGFTAVEAMHAGLPIVSTRCGGPDAMIEESGAGFLTAHEPEALAQAAARIAREAGLRDRLATASLAYAQRVLAPEPFAHRVREISDALVAGRVGHGG